MTTLGLLAAYTLLIFPLGVILWFKVPLLSKTLIAVARMTAQLLFVGLYLQVVFRINSPWLNAAWLLAMILVADISIVHGAGVRVTRFATPLFAALLVGASIPLLFFVGPILRRPGLLDAQYVIPIAGMIVGNCLRATIIGVKGFYESIRKGEKAFLNTLAQGARLREAAAPYLRDALESAMGPTVASIATIGLVALPGMMTGVILGGANPMTAIKYQIAIMIAILTGTAITVVLAVLLTMKSSFTAYGILDKTIFKK